MSNLAFQLVGIVHGSLGAGLFALLALSIWLERRGEHESFGSGLALCSVLQLVQAGVGLVLSRHYDGALRSEVLRHSPWVVWWLERKEHLAMGAIALTWCALAAHAAAMRAPRSQRLGYRVASRRAAWSAASLSLASFALGIVVASAMTTWAG